MATKRITFRLYPNKEQNDKLHYWRRLHKDLYNACVVNRKTQYKKFGKSINYFDQQNSLPEFKKDWPEYKELGSHALQATVKQVDFAFQRFFKLKLGYPKLKSSRKYKGWTYPDKAGWKIDSNGHHGKLKLSNLGTIKMRGKARDWGTPNTCTIIFKQGKWYASITVSCNPKRETGKEVCGIDFGTHHALAFDNGTVIDNPRFLKQSQDKINKTAKKSRKKRAGRKADATPRRLTAQGNAHQEGVKGSRRWKKAIRKVGKIQSKVGRQRQNWHHQVSTQIVSVNSLVATEKLNLKGMTKKAKKRVRNSASQAECKTHSRQGSKRKRQKTGLNRSILDVGIRNLKSLIKTKVIEADGFYIEVPTRKVKPSQTCPNCGHQKKKTLAQRVHKCEQCGYSCDRDVAAAKIMLNYVSQCGLGVSPSRATGEPVRARGQELSSLDAESPSSTLCGSMKQLGAKKRQKRLSQL